jgi:hypothetical protein
MPLDCPELDVPCNGECVGPGETHEGCHVIYAAPDFTNSVNDLFAAGEDLYFATNDRIARISNGGAEELIYAATAPKRVEEVAVQGDSVFFLSTDGTTQTIERGTIGGETWEVISTVPAASILFDLKLFDDYVCALEDQTFEQYLHCAPLSGGDLVDSGYDVWQYTPLGNDLVFYGSNDDFASGTLQRGTLPLPFATAPLHIGSPTSFASIAVSVDGDSVYYVDLNGISRAALAGGAPQEPVFDAELGQIVEIIGGEAFVYTNGELRSFRLPSGAPSRIAQIDTFGVEHLARTTSRVYLADIYRFVEITPATP